MIILDRDGVINEDSDDYIKSVDEWIPIPGSIEAIAALSAAGYTIVVATNQSGIARKYFDVYELAAMHQKMSLLVEEIGGHISGVFFCPHGPEDGPILVKTGKGFSTLAEISAAELAGVEIFDSLKHFADNLLQKEISS